MDSGISRSSAAPDGTGSPEVTVLVPVYNGRATLETCVRSATAQTGVSYEVLLLDDGSTDGSPEVGRALAAVSARVRWATNDRNLGLATTLNRGFGLARGQYVLILHQDCALEGADWLSRARSTFADDSVIGVAGTPEHDVGSMGRREKQFWIIREHVAISSSTGAPELTLFSENKCDLFRRAELQAIGGFDERLKEGGEDQVLSWKLHTSRWRMIFRPDLRFTIALAQGERLAPHLRRERSYGRQMRQILAITGFGAVRRSPGGRADPRLKNRIAGIAWILVSLAGLVSLALFRDPWLIALVLAPPFLRWVQFVTRALRARAAYRLSARDTLATGAIGLLADMAYALGTVSPASRPPPPASGAARGTGGNSG